MDVTEIEALFTRSSGEYAFARWGRPLAPVVFGVDDATLQVMKGALEAVCLVAGHHMAETDPELGSNVMVFFFSAWDELLEVPNLDQLVPDLAPLAARLKGAEANQYRIFRFDEAGAIKACFVFICMDAHLQEVAAETLALSQAVQLMVLWSDQAFLDASPLADVDGQVILKPDIAALMTASYDRVMPVAASDPSHALRLAARMPKAQ